MNENTAASAATDKMLEKVRKLIAKAEGTDSPEEREALIERANALMLQHSISEAMLEASRPADKRIKPEMLEFFRITDGGHLRDQISDLAAAIADYFSCRAVFFGLNGKAEQPIFMTLIGYPSDLRSFQTLFTALSLDLASRINPKPDASKSFDENVWRLRNAGMKWGDIAAEMNRLRNSTPENSGLRAAWKEIPIRSDAQYPIPAAAYRRWCKEIGEAPRRTRTPIGYQREFASAYVSKVWLRLLDQKAKAEEQAGAGTALALRGDSLDDLFAEKFPKLKAARKRQSPTYNADARRAGREAGASADIGLNRMGRTGETRAIDG